VSGGRLTVVGTGISLGHLTLEARGAIQKADHVVYLVADRLTEHWIEQNGRRAESLHGLYEEGKPRMITYEAMIERILTLARTGIDLCGAFYGHPGVFVYPSHQAIRRAREEGISARMLPGISAEDCFFADVGVDPAMGGCQSFEATDFLIRQRRFDPSSHLILWQVGVLGHLDYQPYEYDSGGLGVLRDALAETYGGAYEVVLYEASQLPIHEPRIERLTVDALPETYVHAHSTLYVPPRQDPPPNREVAEALGIDIEEARRLSPPADVKSATFVASPG
jgi:uncharacterized protein YabN with tetrapyrrole methylase and pyrophosphatase domain